MDVVPGLFAHLESLVFDERLDDARTLFAEHEAALTAARGYAHELSAMRGYFAFHDGDHALAKLLLTKVAKQRRPLGARASFYLAGLAYREGDARETKRRLTEAIRHGGKTFIVDWAKTQWALRFPFDPLPEPRYRNPLLRTAVLSATAAIALMAFGVVTAKNLKDDFEQARARRSEITKLHNAQDSVRPDQKELTEVYFVGGAGWSKQTVFLSEVHAARMAFERRYEGEGHAVVLANDPAADEDEPKLTQGNLRSVLSTVGRNMNREDDVLFLYLTSHGSQAGLALSFADGTSDILGPRDLRSMLDTAGIRWRVIVVQGCESGVFLDALANENTLVATAASSDRPSYGCSDNNTMTDFGQAFIVDRFPSSTTFLDALENASSDVRARDELEKREASQPSVRVGDAIRPKLKAIGRAE